MSPFDLLNTAFFLLSEAEGKPSEEAHLRRAVSSAYYALFHWLARECADLLIGDSASDRSEAAWQQVYRALEHGPARTKCKNRKMMRKFPQVVEDFANAFVELQVKRHSADYDPFAKFNNAEVSADIDLAADAITDFMLAPTKDRRAFCAYILFKDRND